MNEQYKMSRFATRANVVSALLLTLILLALGLTDSVHAQGNFVGDGFGGRAWYVPAPLSSNSKVATYVDASGQLVMWGEVAHSIFPSSNEGGSSYYYGPVVSCPYNVTGESNVKLVDMSGTGSINALGVVVRNNGTSAFWAAGSSNSGQPYYRALTASVTDVKHVSAGKNHIAFVKNDGTVWSIGQNTYGAFGNGSTNATFVTTPVQMNGITNAVRVVAFGSADAAAQQNANRLYRAATIVLTADGNVYVAGGGGTVGGSAAISNTPVQKTISNVVDIEASWFGAFALTASGDVYAWGADGANSLGLGNSTTSIVVSQPQQITFPAGTPPIVAIEADDDSTVKYAIDEDGTLWGWAAQGEGPFLGTRSYGMNAPILSALHVADVVVSSKFVYLVRDAAYPAESRLWFIGSSGQVLPRIFTLNPLQDASVAFSNLLDNSDPTNWTENIGPLTDWSVSRPDLMGVCGVISADLEGMPSGSAGGTTTSDLQITKSEPVPAPPIAGEPVTYTIMVTNTGTVNQTNVTVTDVPADTLTMTAFSVNTPATGTCSTATRECTLSSTLAPNASASFTAVFDTPVTAGATISNTAYVVSTESPAISSVSGPIYLYKTYSTPATVDLAITKSASLTQATSGTTFDYTLTVVNNGPDAATNVVATDVLPAGFTFNSATTTGGGSCSESGGIVTCTWPTVNNGATVTATINVTS